MFEVQTFNTLIKKYLSGRQAIADCETIDGDLDLALVDHVYNGLSSCVHWDDWHGEGSITICGLLTITLHLGGEGGWSRINNAVTLKGNTILNDLELPHLP